MKISSVLAKYLALAVGVVVLLCLGYYKLIYQPAQLKQLVRDQNAAVGTVQKSNENLKEGIQFSNESKVFEEKVVTDTEQTKAANAASNEQHQAMMETKVENIKADYDRKIIDSKEPERTAQLIKARERAISQTRIDSLWQSYCKREPTDPDCRGIK